MEAFDNPPSERPWTAEEQKALYEKLLDVHVPPYVFRYAILCDRDPDYILRFSAEHPEWFIFTFFTKTVEEVSDCSGLSSRKIVQPAYVGNCRSLKRAISEIIRICLESALDDGHNECMLDESLLLA